MQFRYASSTNLSSGRCSCMCKYSLENAGSEGGVHHAAARRNCRSRTCPLEQQIDALRFARKSYCAASANMLYLAQACLYLKYLRIRLLRRWMYSHRFFSTQWYLQVFGCWPKNALGDPELTSCLSGGHLLDSVFILQLQPRYLCVPESINVSSLTLHTFVHLHKQQRVWNLAFIISMCMKTWHPFL